MRASTSLHARVEQYLAERRRLGFNVRTVAYSLRGFVCYIEAIGHRGLLTIEVMTDWARRDSHGSNDPHTWARRLKHLRAFARWLRQFEPLTEIPDHTIFGRIDDAPSSAHLQRARDRRSAGSRAAAWSGNGAARARIRDVVRSCRQLWTAHW